jgi:urease accessory protein
MKLRSASPALGLFFLAAVSTAFAHPGQASASGFAAGLSHPFGGWDHLLAMLAIGLWAAQLGGRATWCVPGAFVGVMTLAAVAGRHFGAGPAFDAGTAATVVALGLLIGAAVRLPVVAGAALAAVFAVFHGYTHGAESAAGQDFLTYGTGFVLTSAGLHLAGIGLGRAATQLSANGPRLIGWGVTAAGLVALATY